MPIAHKWGDTRNPYFPLTMNDNLHQFDKTVTTVGSNGAATASVKLGTVKSGVVDTIKINITGSIPATTNIYVYAMFGGIRHNFLELEDIASAANAEAPLYQVALPVMTPDGTELTYDGTEPIVRSPRLYEQDLYLEVTDCNALTDVVNCVVNWSEA